MWGMIQGSGLRGFRFDLRLRLWFRAQGYDFRLGGFRFRGLGFSGVVEGFGRMLAVSARSHTLAQLCLRP